METKVFRYLIVTLIVILINLSTVAAVPSHKNVDEMSYDPEDLVQYFQRFVDDATVAFSMLASENFLVAGVPIDSMDYRLSPIRAAMPYAPFLESNLYAFYSPSNDIYYFLDSAHIDMADIQEGLQTLSRAADPSAHYALMVSLRERIDLLYMDASAAVPMLQQLASLGVDTLELLDAYSAFTGVLASYDRELFDIERLYSSDYTFFTIRAVPLDDSGIIEVSGLLYVAGEPVANNAAVLYAYDAVVLSGTTDDKGHIAFSYRLPLPASSGSISFYAQSAVGGVVYTSNTVSMSIEIPIALSLDKSYSLGVDVVTLHLHGNLVGHVGGALTDRTVVISVNGESQMARTGSGGAYSLSYTIPFDESLGIIAYAEFFPESDEPYLYARSPTLQFTIIRPHELIDRDVPSGVSKAAQAAHDNLFYIFAAAGIAVVIVMSTVFISRRKKRSGAEGGVSSLGELRDIPASERDLFNSEISVLRRVGNSKEAIVVGYGALIGMLDRVGILSLRRDTTHLDIDSTLRSLSYTKPDAQMITKAFELSRYSPFSIGRRTFDAFIGALRSVSERIGDNR